MIAIITLIIFTLILFSFLLGLLTGKLFFTTQLEVNELADSYVDFQKDFADFSDRD